MQHPLVRAFEGGRTASFGARALHAAGLLAIALFCANCNEIVGFGKLPEPRRSDISQCYPTLAPSGPPPASLELNFVDSTGVELREELQVSACPPQAPPEELKCPQPTNQGTTIGGSVSLGWQMMMPGPPPRPPPGGPPPGGPPTPYIQVQSSLYFPTLITRLPPPPDSLAFPPLPIFSLDTLRKPLEPSLFDAYLTERAHLMVLVHDCDGVPAADVEVVLSQEVQDARTVFFAINANGAPAYEQDVSLPNGFVGYLNLPTEGRLDTVLTVRDTLSGAPLFNGAAPNVMLQKGRLTMLVIAR
ncbi:MAG: hypothetical protein MUF34_26865 [Polyangiaceae bacterium]|nr:hypothetical protein [Polyangiaceae bacterium]